MFQTLCNKSDVQRDYATNAEERGIWEKIALRMGWKKEGAMKEIKGKAATIEEVVEESRDSGIE